MGRYEGWVRKTVYTWLIASGAAEARPSLNYAPYYAYAHAVLITPCASAQESCHGFPSKSDTKRMPPTRALTALNLCKLHVATE